MIGATYFITSGLFLSILVLSTPLLRLTIYVEALQFVRHSLEPPIRFPIPFHCSLSSPQLPTSIGYTSPPHRSGGYTLCSTPLGPSIRSTQAPQLPLVRLPSPALALSHTSSYGIGSYCVRLGPVWSRSCELLPLNLSGAHVEPGAGMYARPFVALRGGGVDMNGMWVGTIGGGDGDKDDRDDTEEGVVTREVNSFLGTGTDASLCLETVGGTSMKHRLVQAVFGLELDRGSSLPVTTCKGSQGATPFLSQRSVFVEANEEIGKTFLRHLLHPGQPPSCLVCFLNGSELGTEFPFKLHPVFETGILPPESLPTQHITMVGRTPNILSRLRTHVFHAEQSSPAKLLILPTLRFNSMVIQFFSLLLFCPSLGFLGVVFATPTLGHSSRVGQGHSGLEVLQVLPPVFIAPAIVPTQLGMFPFFGAFGIVIPRPA
ncbi:hypothetical protein C8J55DRAFT_558023 [Lentinula edodes]|uniref:Uncharacterized protein n=1 Tax=Lentinula lateritia TaxID=40482 RepID=A0A9W9ARK5_9AGAR|nr:hypothetical protein C8J55DRAFT_558023 [Lentinula edodes]